jgi:hypothetical protein
LKQGNRAARWLWARRPGLTIAASCLCAPVVAQGTSPLTFEIPAAQQATFGAVSSDPTIRPFSGSGVAQSPLLSWSVDLQGNGRPDFIMCYGRYPPDPEIKLPCRVLRPQADGSVIDVTRQLFGNGALPSMVHPREFVTGDFNGDGLTDIFIAAHGYDGPPFPGETNVLLIANPDGTYTDRSSTLPQAPDFSHSACAGDVNGDGRIDIYVGNVDTRVGPYLLLGNGDGTFRQTRAGLPESYLLTANNLVVERSLACALVDVDADGFTDLVLGAWNVNGADSVIYFNDGTGNFNARPWVALPTGPFGKSNTLVLDIATQDFNRDGRPDLLLVLQYQPTPPETGFFGFGLQVLINQGNGVFVDETAARLPPGTSRPTGPYCTFARFADFNGDGWEDFYCATNSWTDTEPCIWMNQGSGVWIGIPGEAMPRGSNCSGVHAVDFDGDGRPDLLQAGSNQDADVFYRSFLNRTARTVPSEPLIGKAVAGDAEIAVAFAPPLSNGAAPITGYTASCTRGTIGSAVAVAGTSSPITVAGLARGKSYACSVTATNALGTSLPSATVNIATSPNYQGLWWNAPAGSESGWGINFAHQGDTIFATWFTYGADGKPRWLAVTANRTAPGVYKGDLFTTTGLAFSAAPWDPAAVIETTVGSATFTFTGIDHGTFDYSVDAGTAAKSVVAQSKPITRQIFGAPPRCVWGEEPNLTLATNYQDLWWKSPAGSESGWGINLTQQGDTIFATWFTYDANGKPWWLAMVADRVGSKVFSGSIFTATGPAFNASPFDPAGVTETTVGNGTLTFADGNNATFTYTVNGVTQAKPITRQVFAGTGTACQ